MSLGSVDLLKQLAQKFLAAIQQGDEPFEALT
jgi:hypothetical protein